MHPQAPVPAPAPVEARPATDLPVSTSIPVQFKVGLRPKGTPGRGEFCMEVFGLDNLGEPNIQAYFGKSYVVLHSRLAKASP
jgi:hypothetical protein